MLRSTLTQKATCQKQHRDQWLSLKVKFRKPHCQLPLYPLDTSAPLICDQKIALVHASTGKGWGDLKKSVSLDTFNTIVLTIS